MRLLVEVEFDGPARPPPGAPVLVQVRDTERQDAPATTLAEARALVREGLTLAAIEVVWRASARHPTVWAHVDVDRDGRVSRGDFVTMQSYPVPAGEAARVRVKVRRV